MLSLFSPLAMLVSGITCLLLILFGGKVRALMRERHDLQAVQASHIGAPLRLGGVAVIFGVVAASAAGGLFLDPEAKWLLVSALPVLAAGLLEDSGYPVSARARFIAALAAAAIVVTATGVWVVRLDIPALDAVMAFAPAGIAITILFAAGYSHAFNLIDGMNGLAAFVALSSAIGLGLVALQHGLAPEALPALILASAILGFALFNWPVSRLFLGDAGAYTVGHILIWSAIMIAWNGTDVAIPAMLLILFWPIADTAHSMLRRILEGRSITQPDRMHLHQKIRRGIEIVLLGRGSRAVSNPLTTAIMMPFIAMPVAAGVVFSNDPLLAWSALAACFAAFAASHLAILHLAARSRITGCPNEDRQTALPQALRRLAAEAGRDSQG
ncbi:MAG: glycosyltransferase family 4 protein [Rhodobacteraceae bacterium]|nr:glycosyltransferase family 4 protein [Paracoccaceae bacterium]